jgi:hypothetical protein
MKRLTAHQYAAEPVIQAIANNSGEKRKGINVHESRTKVLKTLGKSVTIDVSKKGQQVMQPPKSDHVVKYAFIEPLLDKIKDLNPDFWSDVQRIENSDELESVVVVMPYAAKSFPFCYPVIGLDAATI